jgi:thiopeptide-type bacteriocin biosynthesis protein
VIRDRVCAAAAAYLAQHPSACPHDQETYRRYAVAAARAERLDEHDVRLRSADSVEFIPYRPEYRSYGDEACLDAVERHFVESSRLALRVMVAGTPADRRTALALATLTIALAAAEPDLATAARRARANCLTPPEEMRRVYLARREDLLRQTRELWEPQTRPRGVQAEWRRSIVALRDALEPLHAAGRCVPPDPGSPHAHLTGADRTVPLILLRCAHLLHNRMGVTGAAELLTAHLLAMALSDIAEQRS